LGGAAFREARIKGWTDGPVRFIKCLSHHLHANEHAQGTSMKMKRQKESGDLSQGQGRAYAIRYNKTEKFLLFCWIFLEDLPLFFLAPFSSSIIYLAHYNCWRHKVLKKRAPPLKAIFWPGNFILKTMMFREVTTLLNERKHLKMVIR
jgi:hypothetical protein